MNKSSTKSKSLQWNRTKIHLLGSSQHSYEERVERMKKDGLEVDLVTNVTDLYQSLCKGEPGMVLITSAITGAASTITPEFVHRRFGVPVILFAESNEHPVSPYWEAPTVPDEIVPIQSVSHDELLKGISKWEEKVLERRERRMKKQEQGNAVSKEQFLKVLEEIGKVLQSEAKSETRQNEDQKITVGSLQIPNLPGRGAFIFAFSSHLGPESDALKKMLSLIRQQTGAEANLEILIEKGGSEISRRLRSEAEHVASGAVDGSNFLVAFIDNLPQDSSIAEQPLLGNQWLVPIEDWWSEIELPCEVKLWLEYNKRTVLYVKTGRKMLNESVNRLRKAGVSHLCVPADALKRFREFRDLIRWMKDKSDKKRERQPAA